MKWCHIPISLTYHSRFSNIKNKFYVIEGYIDSGSKKLVSVLDSQSMGCKRYLRRIHSVMEEYVRRCAN